jgi:hypothetical protein
MCTLCRQTDLETQMHVERSLLAASLALVEGHCALLNDCAADFSLLNLPKGKSLGRSKPATNS